MVTPSIRDWILILYICADDNVHLGSQLLKKCSLGSIRRLEDFYLAETRTESNVTYKCSWQTGDVNAVLADCNAGNTLTIVYAGSQERFFAGAWIIYNARSANGA